MQTSRAGFWIPSGLLVLSFSCGGSTFGSPHTMYILGYRMAVTQREPKGEAFVSKGTLGRLSNQTIKTFLGNILEGEQHFLARGLWPSSVASCTESE